MDELVAKHLPGVSRTYALVIPMLPQPLTDAVGLAYLLLRIIDTVEDAPDLSDAQRRSGMAALEAALASASPAGAIDHVRPRRGPAQSPPGELESERSLMADAPVVIRHVHALEPAYRDPALHCARQMIRGVLRMLERAEQRGRPYPAVASAAELREYCYFVAGVVGEMLCAMMTHFLKRPGLACLRDVAIELGIGLQLVNILKDAWKDAQQGRRYLPPEQPGSSLRAEMYKAVLAEARSCLRTGVEFVLALPAQATGLRSFCGLPLAWGAMTLARAARDGAGAKIGRGAIASSITRFARLASDDRALRDWFTQMIGGADPRPTTATT